jgi:hypothetical protein
MSANLVTKEAIWSYLAADAPLLALLHGNSSNSIYERSGPQEAVFPFVVYFKSTGSPDWFFGPNAHVDEEIWVVKGISRGDSSIEATRIADRLEEIMHDAPLAITGHAVLYCRREQDLEYAETEPGATIHHVGAQYRLYREPV